MNKKIIIALASLMFVTMACGLPSLGNITQPTSQPVATLPPATVAPATQPPAPSSSVLFQDDFSNSNSGWDSGSTQNGTVGYGNGGYEIKVVTPNYDKWANPSKSFQSDVQIEVDATKVSGPDKNDMGIICRYQDTSNFYYAVIGNDGYVMLIAYVNGKDTTLFENQTSGVINAGSASNHIRLDCIGDTMTLYANGTQVGTGSDSSLTGGDVGLIAGTYETGNVDVVFNNFIVNKP